MTLNTLKCNHLTPLGLKGLIQVRCRCQFCKCFMFVYLLMTAAGCDCACLHLPLQFVCVWIEQGGFAGFNLYLCDAFYGSVKSGLLVSHIDNCAYSRKLLWAACLPFIGCEPVSGVTFLAAGTHHLTTLWSPVDYTHWWQVNVCIVIGGGAIGRATELWFTGCRFESWLYWLGTIATIA